MLRILISGAGIAGPTLAYWLAHYGFEPTIVEAAPWPRWGGYIVDFWGAGFDVAGRMGILPELYRVGGEAREAVVLNRQGERVVGFPVSGFSKVLGGRYISLPRGDLAAAIFHTIEGRVETIFGDSVERLSQDDARVQVKFAGGATREFDLVVGADGLHSRVRELAFGPEQQFEKYLGYKVAAFQVDGYRPRNELVYVMYTEVGQQVVRFAMKQDRTTFLFTFADPDPGGCEELAAQKALLRKRFANSGWECPRILEALDDADLYFDRVSQIRMPVDQGPWTKGRIILIGDAAFCVSLLAGQGSSLAMVAAYLLAGELHGAKGNYAAAFASYQEHFGPFIRMKQKAALRMAGSFAPGSRFWLFLRNQLFRLLGSPWVAKIAMGSSLTDKIELPEY